MKVSHFVAGLCLLSSTMIALAEPIDFISEIAAAQNVSVNVSEAPSPDGVDAVFKALSLVGTPYRYGGNNPDQGFDCSGFVNYVFLHAFGVKLPRSAAEIGKRGNKVSKDSLEVGDLVFFNTMRRRYSHVGIYIGRGLFIHAPSTGGTVRMDNMEDKYWKARFEGARRFL